MSSTSTDGGSTEITSGDLALAFGLVLAAGASTAVGAASVFFFKSTNLKMLAASLGVSAGVMIYVSFVEIFSTKSVDGFMNAGYETPAARRYATLCFFGGMAVIWLLDKVVHLALHIAAHGMKALDVIRFKKKERALQRHLREDNTGPGGTAPASTVALADPDGAEDPSGRSGSASSRRSSLGDVGMTRLDVESAAASAASTTVALAPLHPPPAMTTLAHHLPQQCGCHAAAAMLAGAHVTPQPAAASCAPARPARPTASPSFPSLPTSTPGSEHCNNPDCPDCGMAQHDVPAAMGNLNSPDRAAETEEAVAAALQTDHGHGLSRMGLLAALAIGIHNLPEGLATFVGTLADPTTGVVIAIAIALHNIPEGIVVAMPIYYASGSKWKGFWWGVMSGLTEPIGALLGWAVLQGQDLDPLVYGVMFGLVGGMMVYISLTELLPTALRYDPENRVTTMAVVAGMLVMAASLLLFAL